MLDAMWLIDSWNQYTIEEVFLWHPDFVRRKQTESSGSPDGARDDLASERMP